MTLMSVCGLSLGLRHHDELLVRDLNLTLDRGEIVGLVGESGSGKTMASLALLGLLPPAMEVRGGEATLDGHPLLSAPGGKVHRRTGDITMVFQNARAALNPTLRIGTQIRRVLETVRGMPRREAEREAVHLLERVGLPGAARVSRAYAHQLSGGMCQRAVIAMALAFRPKVLIADEPTTGLDVTVQAQIFDLLRDLVEEMGSSVLFITHDLAAVAEMCDRVAVLFAGQVMETAGTVELFERPRHPYSQFLLASLRPDAGLGPDSGPPPDSSPVAGEEPPSDSVVAEEGVDFTLPGCRFAHRCPHVFDACSEYPPLFPAGERHHYSCFLGREIPVVSTSRS
jgi:peptide/nickel transport system ATP-binding protein